MEACKEYDPQGDGTGQAEPAGGGERAEVRRNACAKNGVEKFPDPKPGQRGILIDKEAGEDPDMPKAQEACQGILAGK